MVRNQTRSKASQSDLAKSIKREHESISSTTEITKKIKKIPRNKKIAIKKKRSPSHSEDMMISMGDETLICKDHDSPIEFICKNIACLKDLCGHCILQHSDHIQSIVAIKTLLKTSLENGNNPIANPTKNLEELTYTLKSSNSTLDDILKQTQEIVLKKVSQYKVKLSTSHEIARQNVKHLSSFTGQALAILDGESGITAENLDIIRTYLKFNDKLLPKQNFTPSLNVDANGMIMDVEKAIESNIWVVENTPSLETTMPGCPKILHWFEWGKKKLNLYNIVTNTTQAVELDISFKIPSFSRSIILPNGNIYLMGGEEPEYFSRKEVYMYDYAANDRKLHSKASMIHKKFDFTLCYLNGYIFVMCGKDSSSEVVDTCEKYNVAENQWTMIAPVKKKRYAASAVGFTNNKIYLFGGRSDFNNTMVNDIEEFNVDTNEWNILNVKNFNLWNPVEVCACIQIKEDQILVFGGSDARIKDSNNSLLFNVRDYGFEKKSELKKPQVFVNAPFLYKNHVYALGNEYYMKHRNLHRYSIEKEEWEIIF